MAAHLSGDVGTAARIYRSLEQDRDPYLDRARESSILTIPSLIPPEGHHPSNDLYKPHQSLGARAVNNLASKLLLALFPNSPFFRAASEPNIRQELEAEPDDIRTEIEQALVQYEKTIMNDVEASGDRVAVFEALKHLAVAGNILLFMADDGLKLFHLDRFVCRRDGMGNALEIVVQEIFDIESVSEKVRELLANQGQTPDPEQRRDDKSVEIYTHIVRKKKQWFVRQELKDGTPIPGSDSQYPLDKSPWLPLRMIRIDGENYGRGYVEEYIGDLQSLEGLSKAINIASAAAAKILFLVDPNSQTKMSELAKKPSGSFVSGNANDVTVLQLQKFADLQTAEKQIIRLETRLEFAFLLNTAVRRNAERVTAEEIRFMAQELEDALGGVYSLLTQEFQLPYVNRKLAVLVRKGKLKPLPKDTVRIKIITGFEALGRGHDRNRLLSYLQGLTTVMGPEALALINKHEVAQRLGVAEGVDLDGLLLSEEEVAQAAQAQQQQQVMMGLMDKATGPATAELSKAVGENLGANQDQAA